MTNDPKVVLLFAISLTMPTSIVVWHIHADLLSKFIHSTSTLRLCESYPFTIRLPSFSIFRKAHVKNVWRSLKSYFSRKKKKKQIEVASYNVLPSHRFHCLIYSTCSFFFFFEIDGNCIFSRPSTVEGVKIEWNV